VPGEAATWRGVSFGLEKPGSFMIDYDMQSEGVCYALIPCLHPQLFSENVDDNGVDSKS